MACLRIEEMEEYAVKYNIPIMMKDGIEFLKDIVKNENITSVLEIGSAIGYSAINMASVNTNVKVVTIEREKELYLEAIKNIKKNNLENQIEIHNVDAFEFNTNEKFDLIFIDAAKSQYIKFFEKFKDNLNSNGVIVSDNLDFHGFTNTKETIKNRNTRQLVNKLQKYIDFLKDNKEFTTKFYSLGDGVSVTRRINKSK